MSFSPSAQAQNFCSLAFTAFKSSESSALDALLTESKLHEIESISNEVLMMAPPKSLIVGIGRSPTPFISSIQIRFPQRALNVPFSTKVLKGLSTEQKNLVTDEILENYLWPYLDSNLQEVVLIDHMATGSSLMAAEQILNKFLLKKNSSIKVSAIAISTSKFEMLHHNSFQLYNHSIEVIYLPATSEVLSDLLHSRYDEWAQFSEFPKKGMPKLNPKHSLFEASLQQAF
jgi:hypothetical protein